MPRAGRVSPLATAFVAAGCGCFGGGRGDDGMECFRQLLSSLELAAIAYDDFVVGSIVIVDR